MGMAVYAKALVWRSGCVEVRGQLVELSSPTMWVPEVKLRSLDLGQAPLPGESPHCPSFYLVVDNWVVSVSWLLWILPQ